MQEYDPLTPSEVNDAAKEFFPLFDIVNRNMPENCTVDDTIRVMETICSMAQKRAKVKRFIAQYMQIQIAVMTPIYAAANEMN